MVRLRILKTYFSEILMLVAATVIITIVVLSWFLNYHFEQFSAATVNRLNREFLAENRRMNEYLQKMIRISGMELFLEPSIQNLMYRGDLKNFDEVTGIRRLDAVMSAGMHIHSIYVYNGARKYVYATSNVDSDRAERFRDQGALSLLGGSADRRRLEPIPRFSRQASGEVPVYSFVFYDIRKTEPRIGGALIMNITLDWLREVFLDTPSSPSRVMFVDADGTIAYHSDPSMFLKNIAGDGLFRRLKARGDRSGSFSFLSGEDEVFVFYSRSGENSPFLIRTYPYGAIMGEILARRRTTMILVLVCVPLAMLLVVAVSRKLYRPIRQLVRRVDPHAEGENSGQGDLGFLSSRIDSILSRAETVEETAESYRKLLQTDVLRGALSGKTADPGSLLEQFREFRIPFSPEEPFGLTGFRPFTEEKLDRLRSDFPETALMGVPFDGERMVVLFQGGSGRTTGVLCSRAVSLGARIAVGSPQAEGLSFLPGLADSLLRELRFSFLYPEGTILGCPKESRSSGTAVTYPTEKEKELLQLLRQGRAEDAFEAYLQFFEAISGGSFTHFRFSMKRLYISLQLLAKEMGKGFGSPKEMNIGEFEQTVETLEDRTTLDGFFREWFEAFEKTLQRCRTEKNRALVEQIRETVREEYANPNLCQQYLADRVGLSVSHVSKIFKEAGGVSLSDYCLEVRMEKVSALLAETDIPVRDAAAAAGFSNENYFYTLFRKRFGTTPGEYRSRFRLR
ncbi:cache domain-containing protein [Aminivibrio pyruvatiphilus]|jgi:AraC-like DNA-binding protein|uniref:Cache domain-containing protein n=1 Tax=Aminivibrio pyruvatiphilus TaxID=1005740 RepID=A0A4V3HGC4_9BACT|nr:helix-turn-helix domain-containing protein [Aminivibrio pyruvatiphilus]TDY60821.1 cache domain-containing protein [Aminivibrio pyruvatiphilus]